MASERYFIGPGLKDKLREVIHRVDEIPRVERGARIPTVETEMLPRGGKVFRICTFTGSWNIDAAKTVTFKYQTATPNTVSATNLFANITATGTRNCAIAKEGTAWFLIAAQC